MVTKTDAVCHGKNGGKQGSKTPSVNPIRRRDVPSVRISFPSPYKPTRPMCLHELWIGKGKGKEDTPKQKTTPTYSGARLEKDTSKSRFPSLM